jgi:hypothetical protein
MLIIHSSRVAISYMAFPNLTMRTACLMVPHVGQERSLGDYNSIIDQRAPLNSHFFFSTFSRVLLSI